MNINKPTCNKLRIRNRAIGNKYLQPSIGITTSLVFIVFRYCYL